MTAREDAMERSRSTDHLTRAGLNLIQQALSIYDADLRLAVSNRPFKTMFGLPEHLVTPGASFEETIRYLVDAGEYGDVADAAAFVRDRVEAARAFVPHYMERRRANGRTISVEGSPLPGGGWVTVYTDITSVKRQEELLRGRSEVLSDQLLEHAEQLSRTNRQLEATIAQLEEAKRELTEMEARTRLTTEMTPAHIAHVDRDGTYTFTNRRLATLLPDRQSDIVGLSFEDALGPVAERLRPTLDRALAGEASVLEFTEPSSGRRIRTAFTPDQIEDGQPINGVYLLSTDVTEEAQARAALAQTHKRELAAQLTSGLAHDFANLLTIILGLQGRLEKLPLPGGAKELIGATQTAARRGGLLLDKIARMSGPIEMRPTPVVLRDFLDSFAPLACATLPPAITFDFTCEIPHQAVLLDAGSLQDSLLNLVLNARDAIGETDGAIQLNVRTVQEMWLDITVSDSGSGFGTHALQHALDPFFTTKGDSGSGLGLSMVYDMAKLAGGQVQLANQPGSGARVTLRLPLKPAEADARPRLVMVVDDIPDLRAAVRMTLTDMGHQVIEAATVDEALSLSDIPGLDWVISDLRLGGEDGLSLLGRLAQRAPHLQLALMTSVPASDPRRVEAAARWPVLPKPVDRVGLARLFSDEAAA
jgi:PAS domain S-box-containing protein